MPFVIRNVNDTQIIQEFQLLLERTLCRRIRHSGASLNLAALTQDVNEAIHSQPGAV